MLALKSPAMITSFGSVHSVYIDIVKHYLVLDVKCCVLVTGGIYHSGSKHTQVVLDNMCAIQYIQYIQYTRKVR